MDLLLQILIPLGILGILGLIFGLVLGLASAKLSANQSDKTDEIRSELPGANCGGCGFLGCEDYAKAIAKGEAKPDRCSVGGSEVAIKIAAILGTDVKTTEKKIAFIACQGDCEKAPDKVLYYGAKSCEAAKLLPGGTIKACSHGCMGFGSCAAACPFDAISVSEGIAKIDDKKCTGCGVCVNVCPNHIIQMIPASSMVRVACSNTDSLKEVSAVCKTGCVSCGVCVEKCPQNTITMNNNLPIIDYELCIGCGTCTEVCKRKVIVRS